MVKQGYKQTEIGVIPEDWEVVKIEEVCEVDSDNLTSATDSNYEMKYISLEYVDKGRLLRFNEIKFCDAPSRARRKLKFNDILVSTVRPNLKSHYLFKKIDNNYIASTGFAVLRTNQHSGYIYNHFFADTINRQIENLIVGSNYPAINSSDVKNLQIPLPPLAEQEAIAEALSDADAWIESLEQLIAKKRLIKQGAMQELLTPKEDWEVKKFEDIFIRIASKKYQINSSEYFELGKYPIVDQGQQKIVGYSERDDKVFDLQNIIIFGDHTRIIKYVDYPFIVGADGVQILSSIKDDIKFLYYLLNVYEIPNTGYNRHFKYLKDFDYCIPSLSEQTRIATILSDMDAELEALEQKLSKARQIKQGMMQELLTGRVRLVS